MSRRAKAHPTIPRIPSLQREQPHRRPLTFEKTPAVSQRSSHEPTQPEVTTTIRIDQFCDQFEKACQAGKPPMIEEFLLQSPPGDRERLLGELLEIELDFRQRSGSFLQVEDYRCRFPESANLIDNVFRRVVK